MILLKEKYGTLEYDKDCPCITATFTGFMTSDQFRSFLNKGLELMIEKKKIHGRILWLADTNKHVVQGNEDTLWVAENWTPRALKEGIRHVAFVLPDNVFGEMSVKSYSEKAKKQKKDEIIIEMFDSVSKAKEWFKTVSKSIKAV